jgi:hypothetical protein
MDFRKHFMIRQTANNMRLRVSEASSMAGMERSDRIGRKPLARWRSTEYHPWTFIDHHVQVLAR